MLTRDDASGTYTFDLGEGAHALARFSKRGDALVITHTEVPVHLEGRGHGSAMMRAILDDVRANGEKVIPLCSFALDYIRQHPDTEDLLAHAM